MQKSERFYWIDWAKSIGIFLVVLGHVKFQNTHITQFIYSFHIPLFFFVSGFLDRDTSQIKFKDFAIKNAKRLLIPYLFFKIIFIPIYWYWFRNQEFNISLITRPLVGIFLGNGISNAYTFSLNTPTWFLYALFLMKILQYVFTKYFPLSIQFRIMLVMSILGVFLRMFFTFLPFCIDAILMGYAFFFMGKIVAVYKEKLNFNYQILIGIAVASLLLLCITNYYNGRIDICKYTYGKYPILFYLSGVLGIICCVSVSQILAKIAVPKAMLFISENTLSILGLHLLINAPFFIVLAEKYQIQSINFQQGILLATVEILLTVPLIILLNKYLPALVGRK